MTDSTILETPEACVIHVRQIASIHRFIEANRVRPLFRWLVYCSLGFAVGCGGDALSTSDSGTPPPHSGMLIPVPGGKCFIEVVKKDGQAPITSEVSFYLYRDRYYTPYDPVPESGELLVGGKQKIPLKPDEEGCLVTPSGPVLFAKKEVEGLLSLEIDGENCQIPVGIR